MCLQLHSEQYLVHNFLPQSLGWCDEGKLDGNLMLFELLLYLQIRALSNLSLHSYLMCCYQWLRMICMQHNL